MMTALCDNLTATSEPRLIRRHEKKGPAVHAIRGSGRCYVGPVSLEAGVKEIPLTRDMVALVDDKDYDWLSQWKWHAMFSGTRYYAARKDGETTILMHRLILDAPAGRVVDHLNDIGLDNRRANLRLTGCSSNEQRAPRRNISNRCTYRGVRPNHKRFSAVIRDNYRQRYLGTFDTIEEAAVAYDLMALQLHGRHAYINFPQDWYERRGGEWTLQNSQI